MGETTGVVEHSCKKCGLLHGGKVGPRRQQKRNGLCSIRDCSNERDGSGRYCRACRAQWMRGHRFDYIYASMLKEDA